MSKILSWKQLESLIKLSPSKLDRTNGPTNSQATLRLFGQPESNVRVTLFRDNHAWCPYCQKVWLWLEEKQIPYKVKKVTMFCYGDKEPWYKKIVPSGMLPALELDGRIITESDKILATLEREFGPVNNGPQLDQVKKMRQLERALFSSWCSWLCYPNSSGDKFIQVAQYVNDQMNGPFLLDQFSCLDIIFAPFLERMNASLFYYKGFTLRHQHNFPKIYQWFNAMEQRSTYLGTQSDFHTHVHDLPPQMGGCFQSEDEHQEECRKKVDSCIDFQLPENGLEEPEDSKEIALQRVVKHKDSILKVNPLPEEQMDIALRAALTNLMSGKQLDFDDLPKGSDVGLRYIKDRINVPRDMPLWSARRLRQALEWTALSSNKESMKSNSFPIPTDHRRDQDPKNFRA